MKARRFFLGHKKEKKVYNYSIAFLYLSFPSFHSSHSLVLYYAFTDFVSLPDLQINCIYKYQIHKTLNEPRTFSNQICCLANTQFANQINKH